MSTTTELSDRQVIEACAELCGLEGKWREGQFLADGWFCGPKEFNPLTDANAAWRVLEAVRGRVDNGDTRFSSFWPFQRHCPRSRQSLRGLQS